MLQLLYIPMIAFHNVNVYIFACVTYIAYVVNVIASFGGGLVN